MDIKRLTVSILDRLSFLVRVLIMGWSRTLSGTNTFVDRIQEAKERNVLQNQSEHGVCHQKQ